MTTPRQRLIVEACDDTLHIPLPPELRHRRLVVTMEPVDRAASPASGPNRDPEHIKRVLAETWGAWGNMPADEIDRMIEESRRSDCSEPWEVGGEFPA